MDETEGAACDAADELQPCADDDTFCLNLGGGHECVRLCKGPLDADDGSNPGCPLLSADVDPDQEARTCNNDVAFPGLPAWLGVCEAL